jgi:hypothetical protein
MFAHSKSLVLFCHHFFKVLLRFVRSFVDAEVEMLALVVTVVVVILGLASSVPGGRHLVVGATDV